MEDEGKSGWNRSHGEDGVRRWGWREIVATVRDEEGSWHDDDGCLMVEQRVAMVKSVWRVGSQRRRRRGSGVGISGAHRLKVLTVACASSELQVPATIGSPSINKQGNSRRRKT